MKMTPLHPIQKKLLEIIRGTRKAPQDMWHSKKIIVFSPETVKKAFKLKSVKEARRHLKIAYDIHEITKKRVGVEYRGTLKGQSWNVRKVGKDGKPTGRVEKIRARK